MPFAAPHVCPHPGCKRVAPRGKRCAQHQAQVDVRRRGAKAFYSRPSWRALRLAVLAAQPVCPGLPGLGRYPCGQPTTHVDHVVSRAVAPGRSLDPSNLQAYCVGCHSAKTCAVDGGYGHEGGAA